MIQLIDFSLDTENPEKNYNLAVWYENQKQYAPAHSYYLRCAERSKNDLLTYKALIRCSFCYGFQGSRDATEKNILENALNFLPQRPDAYYFLSLFYERKQDWQNCYTYANLALQHSDKESIVPEYEGKHLLIYQKAVSAWWWGKSQESRNLFYELLDNYWNDLSDPYKKSVENNISRLGLGPNSQSYVMYDKTQHSNLIYKFPGSSLIENNYSQVFQDMFVLSMTNGKRNGTFLEIGAADPFKGNNTALLEKQFSWTGVSLEYDEKFITNYRNNRSAKLLHQNALDIDYTELLQENFDGNIIDYLQLDIEPARNTYECMLKIPFDEYKFAVITYEHDYYVDVTRSYREKSREFLKSKGYVLVVNDISSDGVSSFEDWWVHPDLVAKNIINIMKDTSEDIKKVEEYMLSNINLYYSEFETDRYVRENFFPDFSYKGIMVEVGAGPPTFISSSKHFRDNGWRTIGIDPNPKFVKQHLEEGSEIYQYACSNEEKKTTFVINYNNDDWYSCENDGVSFSSLDIRYQNIPEHNTQEHIEVETIRLNTLLERINVDNVDILSVDVEGWELEVMMGFDVNKYNPKVIILENFEENNDYEVFMKDLGYIKHHQLSYNEIYIKNTKICF